MARISPSNMADNIALSAVDYVLVAVILAVPVAVGIYTARAARHSESREEYLLGGRKLHVVPVTLSMFVTFMSATSLIGMPAETYTTSSDFAMLSIAVGMSYLVGMFTVVPIMHPLKVTSMYEYFQVRFQSYSLRILVTVIGMIQKVIFVSVVLLSPALSIQAATSLPFSVSVVTIGLVGLVYTSIGGIRGVVLVDVFQAAIILIGVYAVMIKGISDVGGLSKTWELAEEGGRIQPVDVYAINIFLTNFYIISVCFLGIVAYAYFTTLDCDPMKSGAIANRNQLMPYMVMTLFRNLPGMTGLYLATILSGALSTTSSVINALAANTIEDLLKYPFMKWNVSEKGKLLTAKLAVCFYGGVSIGLAFLARELPGTVIQTAIALLGAFGGPIVGVFFLGALVPWTNKIGAFIGVIVSLVLNVWLAVGAVLYGAKPVMLPPAPSNSCFIETSNFTTPISTTTLLPVTSTADITKYVDDSSVSVFTISYQYYGLTGWLIVLILGLPISFFTRKLNPSVADAKLLFPFVRPLWKVAKFGLTNDEMEEVHLNEEPPNRSDHEIGNSPL